MRLRVVKPSLFAVFLILFLSLVTNLCFALSEDREQVMQLSADAADLNQEKHRGVYIGNVEIDQGSTHIRAAKSITVGNSKNQLIKAIIKGNKETQAHYWALTAKDKPPIHAYADNIYYYPDRHLIKLIGNARVEQGANLFLAPSISYDTLHQHVITKPDGESRTTIVIHPEKNS